MAKHKETPNPEKLLSWLQKNKDSDKVEINGIIQPLVRNSVRKLEGYIPAEDYNLALLYECAYGGGKPEIANIGSRNLIDNGLLEEINWELVPALKKEDNDGRLFRAYIPQETLEGLEEIAGNWKLRSSQLVTLVVRSYHTDAKVQKKYGNWLQLKMRQTGLTQEEIEDICYARYRVEGVTKRYNLAKAGDPEAAMEKMIY